MSLNQLESSSEGMYSKDKNLNVNNNNNDNVLFLEQGTSYMYTILNGITALFINVRAG